MPNSLRCKIKHLRHNGTLTERECDRILKALEQQPTRPTGRWIEKEDYNLDTYYECSECGADYCIEGDILIHKYCPNCGARMAEVEPQAESEEEDD